MENFVYVLSEWSCRVINHSDFQDFPIRLANSLRYILNSDHHNFVPPVSLMEIKRCKINRDDLKELLSSYIVLLTIWHHLFLEFWLVSTWLFAHGRHQHAVTHLENVRQLNIRRGKKMGFQLAHRQPPQRYLMV